jgi:hypothetical protein
VRGDWRKLHNEELHNLYSSPNIIRMTKSRRIRWAGACSKNGGEEECIWDSGGKARRKETTRKTRCRLADNIKIYLRETGWGGMDWINLAQDRDQWRALVNMIMNLQIP